MLQFRREYFTMRMQIPILPVWLFGLAMTALPAGLPNPNYEQSIKEWRAQHESQLKADDGWLTVVGLDWLKEGVNRIGSNPTFEVRLPKGTPDRDGTITVKAGKARFRPQKGLAVTFNGAPAVETEL